MYSKSKSLIDEMINASASGDEEKVLEIKSVIESTAKPAKGDRKSARALNDKALFQLNAGNFDSAVELLSKAYETDQTDTEIASNLGYALIKSGKIKQAQAPFNHSIMLNPNRAAAWANLSEVFADKGDLRSATAVLNIAYLLSTNKDTTKVYFQKLLIDNQENKTLVAAATEALKDEGIKSISESVFSDQPDSTNIANESTEVTTSANHVEEPPDSTAPSLLTHPQENEQYTKLASPTPPLKANESNDFSQMTNESNEYRQMKTFMNMDIDEVIQIFYFFCIALLLKGLINLFFLASSNSHDMPTKLRNKRINRRINLTIFAITVILIFLFINDDADQQPNTSTSSNNSTSNDFPECTSSSAAENYKSTFDGSQYAKSLNLRAIDIVDQKEISKSAEGGKLVCQATIMLNNGERTIYTFTFTPAREGLIYIEGRPKDN